MLLLEQLFRFFHFGKISLRIEFSEDGGKHLRYRARSVFCLVQARKSKGAAQLESLRLLASCDFQRPIEGIFGTGSIRVEARQQFALDAMPVSYTHLTLPTILLV